MSLVSDIYLLAGAISLAAVLAILTRRLRQPLVVSYILAGGILAFFGLARPQSQEFLSFLPEIGLAFLLFLVGMELDLREFRRLGRSVVIAAIGQVALSTFFLLAILNRLGAMELAGPAGLMTAAALSFSSTILVVKLLSETKELVSLHGKMAIGVLLLEDLLAVLILMLVGLASRGEVLSLGATAVVLAKAMFLIWLALYSGKKILPVIFKTTAENGELLFLTAIGWCLLFVSLSLLWGFSVGIGAFLAGVSLAQSVYRVAISGKVKPLRDFFIMIFFVGLGTSLSFAAIGSHWLLALGLTAYVTLIKPTIFFLIFVLLRFRVHTAFKAGLSLSSVSEFSLIILYAAGAAGLIGQGIVTPVVLATVASFIVSSFLVTHCQWLYALLKNLLKPLEREKTISLDFIPDSHMLTNHAVLVGCHRSGLIVLKTLKKLFGENLVVVDFNPEVIEELKGAYVPCLYGDIADAEVAQRAGLPQAKLVVSTVRDLADNLALLDFLEKVQSPAVIVMTAADVAEAVTLYERGAHHVSLPLNLEGASISHLLNQHYERLGQLVMEREKKLGDLKKIPSL